ncbi:pitrilysin family protein [Viridibacillus arvi]|uniref:EF-P 5-aminopentanol modification-associated protein YfmH n=1 Tax=Viridibacillus arvi TaxID=263475 RepID=UPI003D2A972B
MECLQNEKFSHSVFCETFSNGMEVHMIPLKGMSQTFAVLNVNFGANDTAFISTTTKEKMELPYGTAHFMEHLIFNQRNMHDMKKVFSENGASISAKTGYNNTDFLVSSSGNIAELISKLLASILSQGFTTLEIENEKKVIREEILMYQDKPNWVVYRNLLMQMYPDLPICTDVAGTIESINRIDKGLLVQAHDIYYRPNNMKLVVVGDVHPIELCESIYHTVIRDDNYAETKRHEFEQFYPNAKNQSYKNIAIMKNCSHDLFSIGLRHEDQGGNYNENHLAKLAITEALFGLGSTLTMDLYRENLINNQWGYSNYNGPNYDFTVVSGSTVNILPVIEKLYEKLQEVRRSGLNPFEIERVAKKMIGQKMMQMENMKEFALAYSEDLSNGLNYFKTFEHLLKMDAHLINSRLESIINFDNFLKTDFSSLPMIVKR